MMGEILVYVGSAVIFVWGVGHIIPTRSIVAGFGDITTDNRRIITMEWMGEGLTLCFLGVLGALVALVGGLRVPVGRLVIRAAAGMLFVLAGLTAATAARTPIGPIKACPIVKSVVAALYVVGAGMA
jgi:hypothetical protein